MTQPTSRNGESDVERALREMNEKAGRVFCEQCSRPNWKVWHLPGQHQPATKELP